jgi:fructokinase
MPINNRVPWVVGLGEVLWDLLPQGKQLGGAPANFAFHAQALGAKSFVVSKIGNDVLGKEILNQLDQIALNRNYITVDTERPTGTVDVQLDRTGKPNFIIHQNVAWDYMHFDYSLQELAQASDAVCFGSLAQRSEISRNAIKSFLKYTPQKSLRVFDINLRQSYYDQQIVLESLTQANCLKLNEEELPIVAQFCSLNGTEDDILAALLEKYNLLTIALTKGAQGSRLYSTQEDSFLPAPEVTVVDTVGAGDAFTAMLVMGLLKQLSFKIIHQYANKLAAYVCTQKGATPLHPGDNLFMQE